IGTIPPELVSHIFELGYFDGLGRRPNTEFRSRVCKITRWLRDIALSTPSLWSVIQVSPSNIADAMELLPLYLERSREYPLDIQLDSFWSQDATDILMEKLIPHSKRWRRLHITSMNDRIFSFVQDVPVPILEHLSLSHFSNERRVALPTPMLGDEQPRLTSLSLHNVDIDNLGLPLQDLQSLQIRGYGIWPNFAKLSAMISGSTRLQNLVLHVKPATVLTQLSGTNNIHHRDMVLTLPELKTLQVHTSEWFTSELASFVRVFSCPKLCEFTLQESPTSPVSKPSSSLNEIWCSSSPQVLYLRAAQLTHAYRGLSPNTFSQLNTLELRQVVLPCHLLLKQIFASLQNLRVLFLLDFDPNESLLQIMDDDPLGISLSLLESSIPIPTLQTLMINFSSNRAGYIAKERTDAFLSLFTMSSLSSLLFKNLNLSRWTSILECFTRRAVEYPLLTSLTLVDMTEIIPAAFESSPYASPPRAFPLLQRLALNRVHSNTFLYHLLQTHLDPSLLNTESTTDTVPWPDLRFLAVCGDPNVGKALLHRVITVRMELRRPLEKLYLDRHFSQNVESW
ncbi:hypothetical protein BJ165DRAFT_1317348, partial [Panaeolus papilionaceus]